MDYIFDKCHNFNTEPFNIKNNNEYQNEIDIIIKIEKNKINNKIYFLDNDDSNNHLDEIKHFHDGLKELNDKNTELYINNKTYKYKKYFIPKKEGEYKIKIKFNINLTNCSNMFRQYENIINIDFISFNTKLITNMKYMFYYCKNLKNINLSFFDTQNVKDMSWMFTFCKNLKI